MQTKQISKARKITSWVLTGLLSALFIMAAIMKFIGPEEVVRNFVNWGLDGKLILIGGGELIAAILFLIPRTSSLGVLLLTSLMGGAIATHMEHGEIYIFPSIILVLVLVANYLRNPEMFSSFTKK